MYKSLTKFASLAILAITLISTPGILNAQTATNSSVQTIPLCEITRTLKVGAYGEDVMCLQRYLNWAGFTIAPNGPGSPGSESVYFGSLTASAVTRWQNTNNTKVLLPAGLNSGTGIFGPLSFGYYVTLVNDALGVR